MKPQPGRIAQYQNLRNVGSDFKTSSSQARRRHDALARQREERRQAFSLNRDGLDADLDNLAISDSSSSDDEQGDSTSAGNAELFNNAEEQEQSNQTELDAFDASIENAVATSTTKSRKSRGGMPKRIKKKWKVYANRLMQGETLDLEHEGLPLDLAGEWLALGPIPKGKRCMAVSFTSTRTSRKGRVTNTILLARTSGKPIARQNVPVLPPNCVLDSIYVPDAAALFILDVLQWKGQSVAEGEAEFRMFWRDSMLSELPAQTVPQWHTYSSDPRSLQQSSDAMAEDTPSTQVEPGIKDSTMGRWTHLLVVPIPCLQASTDFPKRLLKELIEPCLLNETARADVPVMDFKRNSMSRHQLVNYSMSYDIDGISMLVKAAAYESGLSLLAAWVPKAQMSLLGERLSASI